MTGKPARYESNWVRTRRKSDGRPAAGENLDRLPTDEELGRLQWTTVLYYLHETNPDNGLVRDKTPTRPLHAASPLSAWP